MGKPKKLEEMTLVELTTLETLTVVAIDLAFFRDSAKDRAFEQVRLQRIRAELRRVKVTS